MVAVPAPGYAFAGWALSDGLACASGTTASLTCALAPGSLSAGAPATATATFGPVPSTLAVAAGAGGSVEAAIAGAAAETVGPASRRGFLFSAASSATLSAVPAAGYAFAGWTLSGPPAPACAPETAAETCELAAGSVTAGATVSAAFAAVPSTLTVIAGVGGSVDVRGDGGLLIGEVAAGASEAFPFSAASSARLVASPAPGYAFDGWTLSGPPAPACAPETAAGTCELAEGSVSADATAEAAFAAVPDHADGRRRPQRLGGGRRRRRRHGDGRRPRRGPLRLRRGELGDALGRPGRRLRVRRLDAVRPAAAGVRGRARVQPMRAGGRLGRCRLPGRTPPSPRPSP